VPRKGQISEDVLTKVKLLVEDRGLILKEYLGVNKPLTVHCTQHGEITIRVPSLKKGSGCKICANERISKKYIDRGKLEFLHKIDDNTRAVESSYINSTTPMILICKAHNIEYTQTPRDYVAGWRGCPKCRRISLGEVKILNYLTERQISYVREYTSSGCINPETGRMLPFDFYLTDLATLIEYDGEQHFKEINYFKMDLQKRKHLDRIKTEWASQAGLRLIRLPYWDFDNIEEILSKILR
jgi:hypothetical protein